MKVVIDAGSSGFKFTEVENKICEKLIEMGWDCQKQKFGKFKGKYCFDIGDNIVLRTHPLIIELVESGQMKELIDNHKDYEEEDINFVVVNIPDDINWYIEECECSGGEFIVEAHRIWDGERCFMGNEPYFEEGGTDNEKILDYL